MIVSIIIPTHRRPDDLRRLLASIATQDFSARDFEVIVVGNLPDSSTKNLVDGFRYQIQNIHYLEMNEVGVNRARNAGLAAAAGNILYFLDDDCELLSTDQVSKLHRLHLDFSEATAVGGAYLLPNRASKVETAYHTQSIRWMGQCETGWMSGWRLLGGNVSYKREQLQDSNIQFNPAIVFGGSETEMHTRLHQLGHGAVFHSSIPVIHHCRLNLWGLVVKAVYQGFGAGRLDFELPESKAAHPESRVTYFESLYVDFFNISKTYARTPPSRTKPSPTYILTSLVRNYCLNAWEFFWGSFWGFLVDTWRALDKMLWLWRLRSLRHGPPWARTSSTLHRLWQSKMSFKGEPAVYIPAANPKLILEFATISGKFGFKKLIFLDEIFAADGHYAILKALRASAFEIEILYRSWAVEPNALNEADGLGCILIPFFSDTLESDHLLKATRVAVGPDVSPEVLHLIKTRTKRTSPPQLAYVDIFENQNFESSKAFEFGIGMATNPLFAEFNWEIKSVYQPFHQVKDSLVRFLEGEVVWQNRPGPESIEWSIIIPCHQCHEYLAAVVSHLLRQSYDMARVEIILVDDGSEPAVHTILAEHLPEFQTRACSIRILRIDRGDDSTFRAAVARNAGVLESRGEKLLFMDADIIVNSDHLRDLDDAMLRSDVIQCVRKMLKQSASSNFSGVENIDLKNDIYAENAYWESFKRVQDWNRLAAPWKYVCSYCLAVRRPCMTEIKLFRPEFSEYGFEDTELGFRLFQKGFRFHLLQSVVFHLYPLQRSWTVHFDIKKRERSLRQTSKLFYRMHCDPSIFFELRGLLGTDAERRPKAVQPPIQESRPIP